MPRIALSDGQEITYGDVGNIGTALERELYDRLIHEMLQRSSNAFFQDGLTVSYVGSTTVAVSPGLGIQYDSTQVDPEPQYRPIYQGSSTNLALSAPDASLDRIDIICVKADRGGTKTESRKYKDPVSLVISPQTFTTETDWQASYQVVAGTPNASPVAPATPAGYIKLAEVRVHAVSGIGSSSDITDKRSKLPVGGDVIMNTLGYLRIPAGSATTMTAILAAIDGYLTNGYHGYLDLDVQGADPAAPAANRVRVYEKGGVMYFKASDGSVTPIGSGGGGGGGANWYGAPGTSPVEDTENGEKVWLFDQATAGIANQKLELWVRVPSSYIAGRQITMYIGAYSPAAANGFLMLAQATLVRKNNDAMSSTANQHTTTNAGLTNTVANQYREISLDLTDALGKINAVAVSPGDLIKVELYRNAGDSDTSDIRVVPSATEVKFS